MLFGVIAFVYASVGFGGASSYLALLALYELPVYEMKLTALLCNIIVVTGGSVLFAIRRQIDYRKILPLVLLSVPMAYIGGLMKLSVDVFFVLLGVSLIVASSLMVAEPKNTDELTGTSGDRLVKSGVIGGAIGMLSGMVGIGGGIFLSPLLHLIRWDTARKIAATASVFILVNSISGLAAHIQQHHESVNYARIGWLCFSVLLGGQLGSRMGVSKFSPIVIRRVTAALVFVAGIQVLRNHLHLHW